MENWEKTKKEKFYHCTNCGGLFDRENFRGKKTAPVLCAGCKDLKNNPWTHTSER